MIASVVVVLSALLALSTKFIYDIAGAVLAGIVWLLAASIAGLLAVRRNSPVPIGESMRHAAIAGAIVAVGSATGSVVGLAALTVVTNPTPLSAVVILILPVFVPLFFASFFITFVAGVAGGSSWFVFEEIQKYTPPATVQPDQSGKEPEHTPASPQPIEEALEPSQADTQDKIIQAIRCPVCDTLNEATRTICYKCSSPLEIVLVRDQAHEHEEHEVVRNSEASGNNQGSGFFGDLIRSFLGGVAGIFGAGAASIFIGVVIPIIACVCCVGFAILLPIIFGFPFS